MLVDQRLVGVNRSVLVNASHQARQQRLGGNVRHGPSADATLTLYHSENGRLAGGSAPLLVVSRKALPVHVLGESADIRFNLDRPGHQVERIVLHGFADTVKHKPCRLLRDTKPTGQLIRRNTVAIAGDKPNRGEPLIKANGRVLKDRADLGRELLATFPTIPTYVLRIEGYVG